VLRILNALLVVGVLVSGFVIYSLEHRTRGAERKIAGINDELAQEREDMQLLNVEWAYLTRPAHLARLARKELGLRPAHVLQIVMPDEVDGRLAERPPENPAAQSSDPLATMLKALQ